MKKLIFSLICLVFVIIGCENSSKKKKDKTKREETYELFIKEKFGVNFQENLYNQASDTVRNWTTMNLLTDSVISTSGKLLIWNYMLDSTICVNSNGNKMIGTLQMYGNCQHAIIYDDIIEFFGSKIKDKWYFWQGGGMGVSRRAFKNHDIKKPLNYQQLHNEAMSSFLGGYLTKEGKINDKWFEFKFRDGYIPFKKRYIYKHILDGQQIDNEKYYFNYQWKKAGLMNWIMKFSNDSIAKVNENSKVNLSRDQENEIRMEISRRLLK